jgi:hypothetical protein
MGLNKLFSSLNTFSSTRKIKINTKKQKRRHRRTKRRSMRGG